MGSPTPDAEARRLLLAQRAQGLAASPDATVREVRPVVVFAVAGRRHAVLAEHVRQILEADRLFPLSGAPGWMLGAIQARARVVPVLNLRVLLGFEAGGIVDATRVILLDDDGDLFGIAVDDVEGHLLVPSASLSEHAGAGLVRAVGPDHLAVIEVRGLGVDQAGPRRVAQP